MKNESLSIAEASAPRHAPRREENRLLPRLLRLPEMKDDCLEDSVERGVIYGTGAYEKGAVKDLPVFQEAYEAGRNC